MQAPISTRERSLNLIDQPHELLVLPERFLKIRDLLSQQRADAQALARIIETDVAIAATLLKIANSSAYNPMNRPLASLSKAIARLGLATSAQIAMSMSLFHDICLPVTLQHVREFWAHSFAVSQVAMLMGKQIRPDVTCHTSDLFMVGLLHDIGCMLIAVHIDPAYFEHEFLDYHGEDLCAIERDMYGLDHAEVGQVILKQWMLPEHLIQAVRHHHNHSIHQPIEAEICSIADQFVHAHWATPQYIEAVQEQVKQLTVEDIRLWMMKSDTLAANIKPEW